MKHLIFLFILAINYLPVNAQDLHYFHKTYGHDTISGDIKVAAFYQEDYLLIVGTNVSANQLRTVYLQKTNYDGSIIWLRPLYSSPTLTKADFGENIKQIDENHFVAAITTGNPNDSNDQDMVLMKFDKEANVLWTKKFGNDGWEIPYCVSQTKDKGFFMVGTHFPKNQNAYFYCIRTDSTGTLKWEKIYTLEKDAGNSYPFSGYETAKGSFIVSGYGNKSGYKSQSYIIKLNSEGNLIWEKEFGSVLHDGAAAITLVADTLFIFQAGLSSCLTYLTTIGLWTLAGEEIWKKEYIKGDDFSLQTPLYPLPDKTYIAAGIYENEGSFYEGVIMKIDSLGNELWTKSYTTNPDLDHYFRGITLLTVKRKFLKKSVYLCSL